MPTVRTTARPWEEIEVTEQEARDLRASGLLAEDQPKTPKAGTPAPSDSK